jgi:hypothetical protein
MRYYALFIGYPRSGHTLIAALLDAHPRMAFANGLDATAHLALGFNVEQLAALSISNSRKFTRHGRRSNGFDYAVPGGWHGRWDRLEVIGDKSGDLFSAHLVDNPELMDSTLEILGERGRFIHVVRNPYDCISTIASRGKMSLAEATDTFFALSAANQRARSMIPASAWRDVYLEDLIGQPADELAKLCRFLGQSADPAYLDNCAQLVFDSPRRSRDAARWTPKLIAHAAARMRPFDWLSGYDFEQTGRNQLAVPLRPRPSVRQTLEPIKMPNRAVALN